MACLPPIWSWRNLNFEIWMLNIFCHPLTAVIFGRQDPHSGRHILCPIHVGSTAFYSSKFKQGSGIAGLTSRGGPAILARVYWIIFTMTNLSGQVSKTYLWKNHNKYSAFKFCCDQIIGWNAKDICPHQVLDIPVPLEFPTRSLLSLLKSAELIQYHGNLTQRRCNRQIQFLFLLLFSYTRVW